jgi:hypothetical protein
MDIGRIHASIALLDELIGAVGQLPAGDGETDGLALSFMSARANLERLAQHYAQLASFPDALWMTAMEGGAPTSDASAETAMLMKWLADNQDKL